MLNQKQTRPGKQYHKQQSRVETVIYYTKASRQSITNVSKTKNRQAITYMW